MAEKLENHSELILEETRRKLLEKIVKLSLSGELVWDFTDFDNSIFGQEAVAKKNGLFFTSSHIQDDGTRFSISRGEKWEDLVVIDSFRGPLAVGFRDLLKELARLDPEYKRKSAIRENDLKRVEMERRSEDETKKEELDKILDQMQLSG